MRRGLAPSILVVLLGLGCGDSAARRPDTGAGAGETPPATVNCADYCDRTSQCFVTLCNEDSKSTQYDSLLPIVVAQCQSTCVDATFVPMVNQTAWQCLFQSSCRQALDYNTCNVSPASYRCM